MSTLATKPRQYILIVHGIKRGASACFEVECGMFDLSRLEGSSHELSIEQQGKYVGYRRDFVLAVATVEVLEIISSGKMGKPILHFPLSSSVSYGPATRAWHGLYIVIQGTLRRRAFSAAQRTSELAALPRRGREEDSIFFL